MPLKNSREHAEILGVRLDSTSERRVLAFIRGKLRSFDIARPRQAKFFIVTPNPEIVMMTQKDKALAKILNSADLALPDGIGLAQAAKFLEMPATNNKLLRFFVLLFQGGIVGMATFIDPGWLLGSLNLIKGRKMFLKFLGLANKKRWRVFLLGGRGVSKKTAETLEANLKRIKIVFSDGPELDEDANPVNKEDVLGEKDVVDKINRFKPHLLFVGFGAPKQEKWLYRWLSKLEVGGAMVVGGTFDYISGRTRLPPAWMEGLGLEWLWRLIKQPQRAKRVLTATVVFPLKVFWYKLNAP